MKTLARFAVTLFLLFAFLSNALPCGPGYTTPLFDTTSAPENPYSDYAAGRLGIVKPTFHRSVLFAAYKYIAGSGLNAAEQQAMIEVWKAEIDNRDFRDDSIDVAVKGWVDKRKEIVGKEEKTPDIYAERSYGGYDFFPNCTKNAFETAAETLSDRSTAHGPSDSNLLNWVKAQDQVFQNCASGKQTPEDAPTGAPDWLQKDRAYQKAAAEFYSLDYASAKKHFAEIAQDTESPWAETADYLVARTLIRQASLSKDSAKAAAFYDEAETHLQKFISRSGKFAASAERLSGLIAYRRHPRTRVSELAKNLSLQGGNDNFRQGVIDYTWLLDKFAAEILAAEDKRKEDEEKARFANSDSVLRSTIVKNLSRTGMLPKVDVSKGEVTLSGRIPKDKLSEVLAAANQASPKSVINNLTLVTENSDGSTTYEGTGVSTEMDAERVKAREALDSGEMMLIYVPGSNYPSVTVKTDTTDEQIFNKIQFGFEDPNDENREFMRQVNEASIKAGGKPFYVEKVLTEEDKEKIRAAIREARADAIKNKFSSNPQNNYEGGYWGEQRLTPSLMPDFLKQDELTDWLFTYQMPGAEAYLYSLNKFKSAGSDLWLMTALSKADKSSTGLPRLIEAANSASRTSPAYTTIAYHQCRILLLQGKSADAKKLIDEMLDEGDRLPISARNSFLALRVTVAEMLEDFLNYSLRKPYGFDFDGDVGNVDDIIAEQKAQYNPEYNTDGREAYDAEIVANFKEEREWQDRMMFDTDTIEAFNQLFPTAMLLDVEKSPALPDYMRERFAAAIWMRAFLLSDKPSLTKITPELVKYRPEFESLLAKLSVARTASARENALLYFVLKNPLLSPYIEEGTGKTDNEQGQFDANDWWCAPYDTEYDDATNTEVPRKLPPRPKFLTVVQTQTAQSERKKLKDIGDAPKFLANKVMAWAKKSPADKRIPEALYIVIEANGWTKYGCGNNEELRDEFATYLKKHYPNSEWTAKLIEEEKGN